MRRISLKLLLEPQNESNFFYVTSRSAVQTAERTALAEAGVLGRLSKSCDGEVPLELHYLIAASIRTSFMAERRSRKSDSRRQRFAWDK